MDHTLNSTDLDNFKNHRTNSVYAVYLRLDIRGQERRSHLSSDREIISLKRWQLSFPTSPRVGCWGWQPHRHSKVSRELGPGACSSPLWSYLVAPGHDAALISCMKVYQNLIHFPTLASDDRPWNDTSNQSFLVLPIHWSSP